MTRAQPIDAAHRAAIRLVYFEGMNKESCPALVCCGGRLAFHGSRQHRENVPRAGRDPCQSWV